MKKLDYQQTLMFIKNIVKLLVFILLTLIGKIMSEHNVFNLNKYLNLNLSYNNKINKFLKYRQKVRFISKIKYKLHLIEFQKHYNVLGVIVKRILILSLRLAFLQLYYVY